MMAAMSDDALFAPGTHRAAGLDGEAFVRAMVRVEAAWLRALATVRAGDRDDAETLAAAVEECRPDPTALGVAAESAGNPVPGLVEELRTDLGDRPAVALLHRGLTSQDVLDTALVLLARDASHRVRDDLTSAVESLAALAEAHRTTVMAGRTLTQWAVPVTFGLTAAQWLAGLLDARDQVTAVLDDLPAQCGGAAGTLALVGELTADPSAAARAFAADLDLTWPGAPWHTRRTPVTRIGDALVGTCDALGVVAGDVVLLARPEIGEVRESAAEGRGGSSTMPHKRNPVLSVLVRGAALQAPLLGAQLHLAAAQAVDQRPDGAWHSEWPVLRRLLVLAVTATSQAAELVAGLEVDPAAMRRRAVAAAPDLLAERRTVVEGDAGDPGDYLGVADRIIDAVLARV
jgi:3-carboxy-cis,cis-muconate cycloisomerase